eukprot:GHVP01031636.1.p1 GENE.GHVP01031636.1~~GHVP01031636.1.p1  ORF type:complete len:648 (+),score=96.75 GHVP01031636.1:112-2055(+)
MNSTKEALKIKILSPKENPTEDCDGRQIPPLHKNDGLYHKHHNLLEIELISHLQSLISDIDPGSQLKPTGALLHRIHAGMGHMEFSWETIQPSEEALQMLLEVLRCKNYQGTINNRYFFHPEIRSTNVPSGISQKEISEPTNSTQARNISKKDPPVAPVTAVPYIYIWDTVSRIEVEIHVRNRRHLNLSEIWLCYVRQCPEFRMLAETVVMWTESCIASNSEYILPWTSQSKNQTFCLSSSSVSTRVDTSIFLLLHFLNSTQPKGSFPSFMDMMTGAFGEYHIQLQCPDATLLPSILKDTTIHYLWQHLEGRVLLLFLSFIKFFENEIGQLPGNESYVMSFVNRQSRCCLSKGQSDTSEFLCCWSFSLLHRECPTLCIIDPLLGFDLLSQIRCLDYSLGFIRELPRVLERFVCPEDESLQSIKYIFGLLLRQSNNQISSQSSTTTATESRKLSWKSDFTGNPMQDLLHPVCTIRNPKSKMEQKEIENSINDLYDFTAKASGITTRNELLLFPPHTQCICSDVQLHKIIMPHGDSCPFFGTSWGPHLLEEQSAAFRVELLLAKNEGLIREIQSYKLVQQTMAERLRVLRNELWWSTKKRCESIDSQLSTQDKQCNKLMPALVQHVKYLSLKLETENVCNFCRRLLIQK